jgi:hypothetical protein
MMKVNYGRGEPDVIVQATGAEITPVVEEKNVDSRQELWDKLDADGIEYKKNMSKSKLEALLK